MDPGEFVLPRGHFVVGYAAGVAVACGGWRARDVAGDPDGRPGSTGSAGAGDGCGDPAYSPPCDGDAEVKRMFVAAGHRRHGYARAVLAELERSAAAAGRRRVVLETGRPQPEAIALYRSSGYAPIAPFGVYRDSPNSRYFAKIVRHLG